MDELGKLGDLASRTREPWDERLAANVDVSRLVTDYA